MNTSLLVVVVVVVIIIIILLFSIDAIDQDVEMVKKATNVHNNIQQIHS
jgi:CHASE3 domain sensor protein